LDKTLKHVRSASWAGTNQIFLQLVATADKPREHVDHNEYFRWSIDEREAQGEHMRCAARIDARLWEKSYLRLVAFEPFTPY
jgi:hypothetical protein